MSEASAEAPTPAPAHGTAPGAAAGPARPALRATCWGTRGSLPTPGPATARYGGNTPCLEVRAADGRCFIFDAGTGIRPLGDRLLAEDAKAADLFLTHCHWDHIQGLPFFAPLYTAGFALRVHGPRQEGLPIDAVLPAQMAPAFFPVAYETLRAAVSYHELLGEPSVAAGVEVAAIRVRHAGNTYGYRIRAGAASLAYVTDNELGEASRSNGAGWYDSLLRFLDGVDLLFHDAMFTDEEYARRRGQGHSTFGQAMRLAEDAGVRRLYFFHHSPRRADADLTRIAAEARAALAESGATLAVGIAAEGEELAVGEAA